MTIEVETRFLGIPIKREPLDEATRVKLQIKTSRLLRLGNVAGHVIGEHKFIVEYDLHRAVTDRRPTVHPSRGEQVYIGEEINEVNFRLAVKRIPGLTKKIVWTP